MNGIIVLDKPVGYTSFDCVAVVRKLAGEQKIGHCGTLDPNATGVLVVCVGKATKIIDFIDSFNKSYRCECTLGTRTDTQDIWGNPIGESVRTSFTEDEIRAALKGFEGEIDQVPPMFSAKWVNGQRAYDLARKGREVELEARKITVSKLDLVSFDFETQKFVFDIECSRGTYVRTICSDLGDRLGCGACMSALRRTTACGFSLDDCCSLEDVKTKDISTLVKPVDICVNGKVIGRF